LYLHYPNDKNTYNLQYQFLLGDAILVLPVLHENKETVKGYFPEGKWQSIWTGAVLDGKQWYTVPAVLGQPAAYIKLNHEWTEQLNELLNVPEKK
jgi:alpha-glucosidase